MTLDLEEIDKLLKFWWWKCPPQALHLAVPWLLMLICMIMHCFQHRLGITINCQNELQPYIKQKIYLLRYTRTGWSRTPPFTTLGDIKHFINAVSAWTAADHTLQNTRVDHEWHMHNQKYFFLDYYSRQNTSNKIKYAKQLLTLMKSKWYETFGSWIPSHLSWLCSINNNSKYFWIFILFSCF